MKYLKLLILFAIGGFFYYFLERMYNGYSAWPMIIVGGTCFVLIGLINELFTWVMPLWLQGIVSAVLVTTVEYVSGLILNVWLKLNIWDYSNLPFNLQGQICLYYGILWIFISLGAIIFDDWLRYWLFDEEKPKYKLF